MARNNIVYSIKITNWEKYNGSMKRGHKGTLISNNFCEDAKLGTLPVTVRWMFLGILLTCGDHTRDTVEMGERQLRELLESSWSVPRALDALQSLQVLTYQKIDPFINRIEKKRIEKKRREENSSEVRNSPTEPTPLPGVIHELAQDEICLKLLTGVTREAQKAWIDAYPSADWICQEVRKANAWMTANPKKAPKNFARFFTNWLSKSFEGYRKGIPSRRMTQSEVNAQSLHDLYQKAKLEVV